MSNTPPAHDDQPALHGTMLWVGAIVLAMASAFWYAAKGPTGVCRSSGESGAPVSDGRLLQR